MDKKCASFIHTNLGGFNNKKVIVEFPKVNRDFPTSPVACARCYKTFYGRNLGIFVISLSVCPW
jgi:hypothetical protein